MSGQFFWNIALMFCWIIVAYGQFHQGRLIKKNRSCKNVSIHLPIVVLATQAILFIKGIYYNDWALIAGCIIVNTGVLYNIFVMTRFWKK